MPKMFKVCLMFRLDHDADIATCPLFVQGLPYAGAMYSIRHAAALTGLPVATLRAWERRYGVVQPGRSDGGYRIYDDRDLELLRTMKGLVAAGWSPRLAAEQLLTLPADAAPGRLPQNGPTSQPEPMAVDALFTAGADQDARAAENALDVTLALGDLETAVDDWLMPALQLLGSGWEDGRVDVAGEHLVSAVVQRRLGSTLDAAGRVDDAPVVLVGLAHGSRHELGILAFAAVLRGAGLDVTYLGADVPRESWVSATRGLRPDAVVLAAPMRSDVPPVRETVAALGVSCPNTPVYVGGSAQDEVGDGARPLGHSIGQAARDLFTALVSR